MIFVGHRRSQPSLPSYTTRPLPYFVPNICSGTLQLSVRLADPAGSPPGARLPDLDILRNGIDATLLGLGRSSTTELTPDDRVIPRRIQPRSRRTKQPQPRRHAFSAVVEDKLMRTTSPVWRSSWPAGIRGSRPHRARVRDR
jgi:hypothetical protein